MNQDFIKTSAYIDFSIWGEDFHPDDITKATNLTPTYVCRIGEKQRIGSALASLPTWELCTEREEISDIGIKIEEMIRILRPKTENLIALKKQFPEYRLSFCIVAFVIDGFLPGLRLTSEQIDFLSLIKADFDCDIYYKEN